MKIRIYCKLGGGIWESGSMKSYWWGSSRSPSVQFLGALCPVSPWPGLFPHLHIQGSYEGRGRRKRAECWAHCMVRWFVGSCYSFSSTSHDMAYRGSQLTGKETQRIYGLCTGHHMPHREPGFYSKQRRNKSCSTQSWIPGGINYSLWSSRYTDICCLLSDLIIIILSYHSFNTSWWMVKFG